jgi:hypothetical protein
LKGVQAKLWWLRMRVKNPCPESTDGGGTRKEEAKCGVA